MVKQAPAALKSDNVLDLSDSICSDVYKNVIALQGSVKQESIIVLAQLSASLIHDLRNPLAVISAGAELLMDGDLERTQSRRLAFNIHSASRRLAQLFQDLVDISRGNREPLTNLRIVDVIQDAIEQVRGAPEFQEVCVKIVTPEWIQIPMRRKSIERVFVNMINNSLESMPAGGHLCIIAKIDGDNVIVTVDDSGRGVPDHVRAKLFEPFVSGGKKNGLGMGLLLSRQTLIEHGGDLWLGNKAGPGARFCLRLPLKPVTSSESRSIPADVLAHSRRRTHCTSD
jgi:signal transduction histidine kinase